MGPEGGRTQPILSSRDTLGLSFDSSRPELRAAFKHPWYSMKVLKFIIQLTILPACAYSPFVYLNRLRNLGSLDK